MSEREVVRTAIGYFSVIEIQASKDNQWVSAGHRVVGPRGAEERWDQPFPAGLPGYGAALDFAANLYAAHKSGSTSIND